MAFNKPWNRKKMNTQKTNAKTKVIVGIMGLTLSLSAFGSVPSASQVIKKYDLDRDGTVTFQEITQAAEAQFAALDGDHDGTIDKTEYMNAVKRRFAAADKKHNGTLDVKELNSKEGQNLRLLLQ
jgi:Ca2+-binding EF-hand superfamily protein